MFGKKKKAPAPAFDVTQKLKKTWYGGKKRIPTTKAEQRKAAKGTGLDRSN